MRGYKPTERETYIIMISKFNLREMHINNKLHLSLWKGPITLNFSVNSKSLDF